MKAIRIHQYGGPEVLAQVEMQRPTPGANEVLIKIHAASVNPFDWKARAGYMKDIFPLTFPATLGSDVSGTVEAVGPGVTGVEPQTLMGLCARYELEMDMASRTVSRIIARPIGPAVLSILS